MRMRRKENRRKAPAWLQWIGQGVSFIVLIVMVLAAIVLIVVPFATGSQTYSVLTSSMAPKYPPGTFLVVRPTEFDELQVGDVVTFQIESARPEVITHRIISLTASQDGERLLITQGDNNDVADPDPVMEVQVRGELFYAVPYVGFVANALGNTNRSSVITVLAVGLIAWGAVSMVRGLIKDRADKRDEKALETATQQLALLNASPASPTDPSTVSDPASSPAASSPDPSTVSGPAPSPAAPTADPATVSAVPVREQS